MVTAPWVRMESAFRAPIGHSHLLPRRPPRRRDPEVWNCYIAGHPFHIEPPDPRARKRNRPLFEKTVKGGEIFKDATQGLRYLAGPCPLCRECAKLKDEPCVLPGKARPSMESCGIDVFQTARNNGFFIETLREKTETQNLYCLMLVD